jgi:hypothetical protein
MRAAPVNAPAAQATGEPAKPFEDPRRHAARYFGAGDRAHPTIAAHAARERLQILLQEERVNNLLDLPIRVRRSQPVASREYLVLEQSDVACQEDPPPAD